MKFHITRMLALNAAVFAVFVTVYVLMDFDSHFECTNRERKASMTISTKLYYAVMNHSAVGCGEIVPKTDFARILTSAHVTLAWVLLCILAAQ